MKPKLSGFIAGILTTTLTVSLCVTALAASGKVSFNLSAIQFNGKQISAAGESYALSNGAQAPSSITYTDENGGGTTYLPARRISELLGVDIGYDTTAGAVTIGKNSSSTETTAPSTDYSDWTAEEEAAYQEFKAMWDVEFKISVKYMGRNSDIYVSYLKQQYTINDIQKYYQTAQIKTTEQFIKRMMIEVATNNDVILFLSSVDIDIPEDITETENDIGTYRLYIDSPETPWMIHYLTIN